jgi:Ubiquinol-cytochrome C reductase, UQCRX/QCR9 like
MGLWDALYRVVMRRNSVYVTFVIAGAFAGERVPLSLSLSRVVGLRSILISYRSEHIARLCPMIYLLKKIDIFIINEKITSLVL